MQPKVLSSGCVGFWLLYICKACLHTHTHTCLIWSFLFVIGNVEPINNSLESDAMRIDNETWLDNVFGVVVISSDVQVQGNLL